MNILCTYIRMRFTVTASVISRSPIHCARCLLSNGLLSKANRKVGAVGNAFHKRLSTQAAKDEWVKPEGYNTGIMVFNSLTNKKEELILPRGKHLSWYSCGPTVYDSSHIGHASNYIRFDIIRRILLEFFDINVTYMMGITDIDDKIIRRSEELDMECSAITSHYEREFFEEMLGLNMIAPSMTSRVTDHVPIIIDFVQGIMDRGHAYVASDGSVYFDVQKYGQYNRFVPETQAQIDKETKAGVKKHPQDFALWKARKPGEPFWESPWGPGRPGWHIECSAMSSRIFGCQIDIHSGGEDLRFPHHENELAQSRSFFNCTQWVNYWLHTGYLHSEYDPEKMSKSLKNTISVRELLDNYSANQFRMFCMLTGYRHHLVYNDDKMVKAIALDDQIGNFLRQCDGYIKGQQLSGDFNEAEIIQKLNEHKERTLAAFRDDFKTPVVISELIDLIHYMNAQFDKPAQSTRSPGVVAAVSIYVKRLCRKLGFHKKGWKMTKEPDTLKLKEVLDSTVKFRSTVREFARNPPLILPDDLSKEERKKAKQKIAGPLLEACDGIRSELANCNISIRDHKDYSSWEFTYAVPDDEGSEWDQSDSESSKDQTKSHKDSTDSKNVSQQSQSKSHTNQQPDT